MNHFNTEIFPDKTVQTLSEVLYSHLITVNLLASAPANLESLIGCLFWKTHFKDLEIPKHFNTATLATKPALKRRRKSSITLSNPRKHHY